MRPGSVLAQARVLAANERWAEALAVLAQALANAPDDADAWCLAAQCQLGIGDAPAAVAAAQNALRSDPESAWAHRLASIALVRRQRYFEARTHADEAVRLDPYAWQSYRQRAEVDIANHAVHDRTWEFAKRAIELGPDEPATHITLGRLALAAKQNRRAAASFRNALALEPDNAVARNNLAVTQLRRRRWRSAVAHLIGALRLSPNDTLFERNLRIALRAWASLLNMLALIGCIVVIGVTTDRQVPAPTRPPTTVATLADVPISITSPPQNGQRSIPVVGRPAALIAVAAVVLTLFVAVLVMLRRTIGKPAARIVRAAIAREKVLAVTVATSVLGVMAIVVAAGAGMPIARPLVITAFVLYLCGGVLTRILRSRARRDSVDLRRH